MTTLYLSPIGVLLQQLSNLGVPLAGGQVEILVAGSVSTLCATYTDSTGTTQNANPIILNSAGRLAASNAPVSVWVPTNTPHKMILFDASGNLLSGGTSMDNLYGINDPYAVLLQLASPSTGAQQGGADIVANAMRSYDVVASVRSAAVPSLAANQTLVIDIEGGTLVGDGNGGLFYWNASSLQSDDGLTVIKPNAILTNAPGRYLRQTNLYGITGTFSLTLTGCTTSPVVTATYIKNGNQITLQIPPCNATSNSTGKGFSGFPSTTLGGLTQQTNSPVFACEDNGVGGVGGVFTIPVQTGGTNLVLNAFNSSSAWTNSGAFQFFGGSWAYIAT